MKRSAFSRMALLVALLAVASIASRAAASCPSAGQVFPYDAPAVSEGGERVAFTSSQALVSSDDNGLLDVYVWTRSTGDVTRVSDGPRISRYPAITPDGRFVAFQSDGPLIAGDDDGGGTDVFVRDLVSGELEQVSVGFNGRPTLGESSRPSISADGRFVAFRGSSSNIVLGDRNGLIDAFVRDRAAGTTIRASMGLAGADPRDRVGRWGGPVISGDGSVVVFESPANNLAPGDSTDVGADIFLYRLSDGSISRVSVLADGSDAEFDSAFPTVSHDGKHVAFISSSTKLVPNDTNNRPAHSTDPRIFGSQQGIGGGAYDTDVFVRDMAVGTTQRVSVVSDGTEAVGVSSGPSISADGRLVSFESDAANLSERDGNGQYDVFVHDTSTRKTSIESVRSDGTAGSHAGQLTWGSVSSTLSPDGSVIAFVSAAPDLVTSDGGGNFDVFVRTIGTGQVVRVSACTPAPMSSFGLIGVGTFSLGFVIVRRSRPLALALVSILFAATAMPALAHHYDPIQPGGQVGPDSFPCSFNYVFRDEAENLYIGTAAHCVRALGADGAVGSRPSVDGIGEFGTVVYSRYDFLDFSEMDFALIEVDADKKHLVDPQIRRWGGPTGVQDTFVAGTRVMQYGQGVWARNSEATRAKTGTLVTVHESGRWEGWYVDSRPALGGDSGSPVITEDGKGLGITIALAPFFGDVGLTNGPTLELIMRELDLAGFNLDVMTESYPSDPAELVQHCAARPVEESRRGEGCVRPNPGP